MDEMQWEDPPEYAKRPGSGKSPGRYVKFAVALKENPGKWAILPAASTSEKGAEATAHNIRRGRVGGFKLEEDHGKFDVAVDGTKIYVRFLAPGWQDEPEDEESDDGPARGDIRAWARSNGFEVAKRGALPREVIDAYDAAH